MANRTVRVWIDENVNPMQLKIKFSDSRVFVPAKGSLEFLEAVKDQYVQSFKDLGETIEADRKATLSPKQLAKRQKRLKNCQKNIKR